MHADRTNRVTLLLFSLVLIAAGGAGFIASLGVFGSGVQHGGLLDNPGSRFVGRNSDWFWPAGAAVALVVVLLALRWLLVLLFSTDRAGDLSMPRGGGAGQTTLAPSALTSALVTDVQGCSGVDSARARVIGDADSPHLVITAQLTQDADLAAVRHRIVDGPLRHAREAVGDPDLPIRLDLLVSGRRGPRVR